MKRVLPLIIVAVGLVACTTAAQYRRPDGGNNFVIACGAAVGWNICVERAQKECPVGFNVLSQINDGNRKEMTIACADGPPQAVNPAIRAAAACRLRVAETVGALSESEWRARVQDCILAAGNLPSDPQP